MHLGCAHETGSRTVQLIHNRRLEIKGERWTLVWIKYSQHFQAALGAVLLWYKLTSHYFLKEFEKARHWEMMHCRQQYRQSPWSEAPHPLNLTFWPSEEPICSHLNTELPQQQPTPVPGVSSWDRDSIETWRQQAPQEFRRHTQELGPDWYRNLTPVNSYSTTAVDIFVHFRVAWG